MISIACATDEGYAPHCAAMLCSAFLNNPGTALTVHLLVTSEVSSSTLRTLRAFVSGLGGELEVHQGLDSAVLDLPVMDRISSVMWYRVLLPELLPGVDRILYLDVDTLVTADLHPLWETELRESLVAAVSNVFEAQALSHAGSLGFPNPHLYFNSGVLLFNLELMRREQATARILGVARTRSLLWPDQDALNLVLSQKCEWLHPRWNCMNMMYFGDRGIDVFGAEQVAEAVSSPGIIHFEGPGPAKPWHYLNRHPRRQDYFDYRAATPWPEVTIAGRTLQNRMLGWLPRQTANQVLRAQYRVRRRFSGVA